MTKVLILTYDFPPHNSIGAQRPYSWFRYFHTYGIHPTVLTRHWDKKIENTRDYIFPSVNQKISIEENPHGTIIRVPFNPNKRDRHIIRYGGKRQLSRRLLSLFYSLRYVTFIVDNTANIYKEARKHLEKNKYEIIIATGEPFILFRYASILSKEFSIPWIADYRDTWSTNHHAYSGSFLKKLIGRIFTRNIEKNLVKTATILTTTNRAYMEDLKTKLKHNKVELIMNGYFDELFQKKQQLKKPAFFEMGYMGTIYPYQKLETFLKGFYSFLQENNFPNDINISFYGIEFFPEQVNRLLSFNKKLNSYLITTKRFSQEEVINNLMSAHTLILLADDRRNQLYAKVFEYIALNKKILVCKNDHGVLEEILLDTQSGILCDTYKEVAHHIGLLYKEWQNTGTVFCNTINKEKYSREFQALIFAELLKKLVHEYD